MCLKVSLARSYCDFVLAEAIIALGEQSGPALDEPQEAATAASIPGLTCSVDSIGASGQNAGAVEPGSCMSCELTPGFGLCAPAVACDEDNFEEILERWVADLLNLGKPSFTYPIMREFATEGSNPWVYVPTDNGDDGAWDSFFGLLVSYLIEGASEFEVKEAPPFAVAQPDCSLSVFPDFGASQRTGRKL